MFQKLYPPHSDLASVVNYIAIYDDTIPLTALPPVLSVSPLPEQCLCIYPFDRPEVNYLKLGKKIRQPQSAVVGRHHNRIELKLGHRNVMIKVSFHPCLLFRLKGIDMNECPIDLAQDSRIFFGDDVDYLHVSLQNAINYEEMIDIIQNFLMGKFRFLSPALKIDSVLSEVIEKAGAMTVEEIAAATHVSVRQLERQIQQRVGMTPKYFIRLCRFAKAWGLKLVNPTMTWTSIAYQSGYYDQMHFIRDFKEFASVPPSVIEAELNSKSTQPLDNIQYNNRLERSA